MVIVIWGNRKEGCMKYLKEHWPVLLVVVTTIYCLIEWIVSGSRDAGDVIFFFILCYGFIIPLSLLIASLWYGYKIRNSKKWLICLGFCIPGILLLIIAAKSLLIFASLPFIIPSFMASLAGMALGCLIWKARHMENTPA